MKKYLVALLVAVAPSAQAADLGPYGRDRHHGSIKDEPLYRPVFSWTGFYIGGHLGGGWGDSDWLFTDFGTTTDHSMDGFVGGVHVGYNYQFTPNLVVGVEGDFTGSDLNGSSACPAAGFTCSTDVNWLGSIRGRLGFAVDRFLIYGTAGWAFADADFTVSPNVGANQSYDGNDRSGWVAGIGAEYAFTSNWIFGVEWKHYDFGEETGANTTIPANSPIRTELDIDTVTARLSYKFW